MNEEKNTRRKNSARARCFVFAFVLLMSAAIFVPYAFSSEGPAETYVEEYDTASPLNFVIDYEGDDLSEPETRERLKAAIHHWAVGLYVMTNETHRLGNIRVMNGPGTGHAAWRPGHVKKSGAPLADAEPGSYIPFSQSARDPQSKIRINPALLTSEGIYGTVNAGYLLAHETAHFAYTLFDEYGEDQGGGYNTLPSDSIRGLSVMNNGDDSMPFLTNADNPLAYLAIPDGRTLPMHLPNGAQALTFSTSWNYGGENQTAQRRMYPSTVGAWNTLRSKLAPEADIDRNFFLDLAAAAQSIDITQPSPFPQEFAYRRNGDGYNTRYSVYEYTGGLPGLPGGSAVLSPARFGGAVSSLDIRFEEESSDKRARVFLMESMSWKEIEEIADFAGKVPDGTHIAVYRYERSRLIEVLPMTRIDGDNRKAAVEGLRSEQWRQYSPESKTGDYYAFLREIMLGLSDYIDSGKVVLGDIFIYPGDSGLKDSTVPAAELVELSRRHFIPVHVIGSKYNEDLRKFAKLTGGKSPVYPFQHEFAAPETVTHYLEVPKGPVEIEADGKLMKIRCKTFKGDKLLTGVNTIVTVNPLYAAERIEISVNDDGERQDAAAGDGVYTGALLCRDPGLYEIYSRVNNIGVNARFVSGEAVSGDFAAAVNTSILAVEATK